MAQAPHALSYRHAVNLLDVQDLRVTLQTSAGPADALRGVSFSLARGGTLGLIGESGCGKSITALALMGLLPDGARQRLDAAERHSSRATVAQLLKAALTRRGAGRCRRRLPAPLHNANSAGIASAKKSYTRRTRALPRISRCTASQQGSGGIFSIGSSGTTPGQWRRL